MKLIGRRYQFIKGSGKKVHIGRIYNPAKGGAVVLCDNPGCDVQSQSLGSEYNGQNICGICRGKYNNRDNTWEPNPFGGRPRPLAGAGYGGSVTNER